MTSLLAISFAKYVIGSMIEMLKKDDFSIQSKVKITFADTVIENKAAESKVFINVEPGKQI